MELALAINIAAFALIGVIWAVGGIVGDGPVDRFARYGWFSIALLLTLSVMFGVVVMGMRSAREASALRAWLVLIVGILMMSVLGELMERDDVAFLSTAGTGLAGAFIALALQPKSMQEEEKAARSMAGTDSTGLPSEADSTPTKA